MDSLLFISTISLLLISFLLIVGMVFSNDEFSMRNEWQVRKNNSIDWKKVDAGRFVFFIFSRAWLANFIVFMIAYIGVKYV